MHPFITLGPYLTKDQDHPLRPLSYKEFKLVPFGPLDSKVVAILLCQNCIMSYHHALQGVTFSVPVREIIITPTATDVDVMISVGYRVKGVFTVGTSLERAISIAELLPVRCPTGRSATASASGRPLRWRAGVTLDRVAVSQLPIDWHQCWHTRANNGHVDLYHSCDARDHELLCFGQCMFFDVVTTSTTYS